MAHRFPALIAAPAAEPGRLWLTGARLFDGTGAPLRDQTAILVEDGIIRRVADARERCPDGAQLVDLGERVLMPGLTDAHTHASGLVPTTAKGAEEALPGVDAHFLQAELRDYLRFGVTTIRVCGSAGQLPQQARQAMRYGAFRGPRLLTCGKIVSATAPGGRFYGDMYREADGTDGIRRAVREQIRAGADFVKTSTGFHPAGGASVRAVALIAETVGGRLGVKASGGIRTTADALAMLDAGATRLGLSGTRAVLDGLT